MALNSVTAPGNAYHGVSDADDSACIDGCRYTLVLVWLRLVFL